ncbi:MAG: OsmC family protein [Candidatus Bipolaricaulota bacterium]
MQIKVKQLEGSTFAGRGDSNHWTITDAGRDVGGADGATRPMELLLIGLGGCTGIDMNTLLNKMQVDYDNIEMGISADRAEDPPRVFTEIRLTYRIFGSDIPEDKIAKAVDLTQEKYCSVTHCLKNPAEISYEYEIIEPDGS